MKGRNSTDARDARDAADIHDVPRERVVHASPVRFDGQNRDDYPQEHAPRGPVAGDGVLAKVRKKPALYGE